MAAQIISPHRAIVGHCGDCDGVVVVTVDRGDTWPPVECGHCGAFYSLGGLVNDVAFLPGGLREG